MRRFTRVERPERDVRALWDMWSCSSEVRVSRPVMAVSRFAWMERILREVRGVRFSRVLILFLASQSFSREVRVPRFSIV